MGHKKALRRRIEAGRLNGWILKSLRIYSLRRDGSNDVIASFPISIPFDAKHIEWLRVERRDSFMAGLKFGSEAGGMMVSCQKYLVRNDSSTNRDGWRRFIFGKEDSHRNLIPES